MRSVFSAILLSTLASLSLGASAQCWPPGRDLSAIELTACFMAEYQRCEEQVPAFKNQAGKKINKLTGDPRFEGIFKSKDFERLRQEAHKNLVAGQPISDGCRSMLDTLEEGKF